MANSLEPVQTAPKGAVCSGPTLFASILNSSVILGIYLQQMAFSDAFFFLCALRVIKPHRRHCVLSLSKNINPSLVLVQPRKTCPFITERLLMGRKESNQTNKKL